MADDEYFPADASTTTLPAETSSRPSPPTSTRIFRLGRRARRARIRRPLHRIHSTPGHGGLGEWRGGHRSAGGRRGVSIGVIVALVAVVVVVGTVILWSFFGDALSNRSHTAAARCVGGKETVAVIVDPSMADQVQEFAGKLQRIGRAGRRPLHGGERQTRRLRRRPRTVSSASGRPTWAASRHCGYPAARSPRPGSPAAAGQKTISDSRSLVTSPVLLAVRPELQPALANQNWAALPGLQTNPNSLAGLNLPAWGSLRAGAADQRQRRRRISGRRGGGSRVGARGCAGNPGHRRGAHPDGRTTQTGGQLADRGDEHVAQAR